MTGLDPLPNRIEHLPSQQIKRAASLLSPMGSAEINSNVISEILSRSSLRTVARCRQLNKECRELTYAPAFLDLLSLRTDTVSGYVVLCKSEEEGYSSSSVSPGTVGNSLHPPPSMDFLPYPSSWIEICHTSNNGFMMCAVHGGSQDVYLVCKPATKQWRCIPRPKWRYETRSAGLVVTGSNPLRFKIVRFSRRRLDEFAFQSFVCEFFDSKIYEWKRMSKRGVKLSREDSSIYGPPVLAYGILHWLTTRDEIIMFCGITDTFSAIPLPDEMRGGSNFPRNQLVNYAGSLGLTRMTSGYSFELWVLENYKEKRWAKVRDVIFQVLEKDHAIKRVLSFHGRDVVILQEFGFDRLFFYNFQMNRFHSIDVTGRFHQIFQLISDQEDASFPKRI